MNKSEFINKLATRFEGNKRAAGQALEAVVDTITREVARGEKVAITGFGAFEKSVRPARTVRNPRTGERIRAKRTSVPKFRPGAQLKDVVSGARKPPSVTVVHAATSATRAASSAAATAKRAVKKATGTTKAAAKKSTAKKSTAKKSTAKKSTAKKSTAKKSPAKKSTAKKVAGAKKTAAKKTAGARKTAAKATARKTAKKSTARKATTKRAPAKRAAKKG